MIFQMGLEEVMGLQKIRKKESKKTPKPNKKANNKKGKAFQVPVIARAEPESQKGIECILGILSSLVLLKCRKNAG